MDLPCVGFLKPDDGLYQRGLAGAVAAYQSHPPAGP